SRWSGRPVWAPPPRAPAPGVHQLLAATGCPGFFVIQHGLRADATRSGAGEAPAGRERPTTASRPSPVGSTVSPMRPDTPAENVDHIAEADRLERTADRYPEDA